MNWKRTLRWFLGGALLLLLVAIVGGLVFVRTQIFHRWVLSTLQTKGSAATGGRLTVQNFDFRFSPLSAHVYGVTLRGNESADAPPLLQVDEITLGLTIQSFFKRKYTVGELLVQHPVVQVRVDPQGQTNLPHPPPSNGSSTNVFDLQVGHAQISNGAVFYNDQQKQLDGDFYNLETDIHFEPSGSRYVGAISYDKGTLHYGQYSPLLHSLNAKFSATPAEASLNPLVLNVGSSRVTVKGTVNNYSDPHVSANYNILVHSQDFASFSPSAKPAGDLLLIGDIDYHNQPGVPVLRAVSVHGELSSAALKVSSPQGAGELRRLHARYQLVDGDFSAQQVAADLLNGKVLANLDLAHVDANPDGEFDATLESISLAASKESVHDPRVRRAPITGTLAGTASGSWKHDINNLHAIADLTVQAAVVNRKANPPQSVPLNGAVHMNYEADKNAVVFRNTSLRMPSTSVTLEGELSNHSKVMITASSGDISQLVSLVSVLKQAQPAAEYSTFYLNGTAQLHATVQGSMQNPTVSGDLQAQNLQVQDSQWKSLSASFTANQFQARLQNLSLIGARQGSLNGSGQVALHKWSYAPSSPLSANFTAKQLSLTDLQRLANVRYPVEGLLSADLSFQGSELDPAGNGSLHISKAKAYDEPIQNFAANFQAAHGTINSNLNLNLPAGSLNGKLSYTPRTRAYQADLNAPAVVLEKLHALQARGAGLSGTLSLAAKGAGTLDNPQLTALVQVPQLQVRDKTISHLRADLAVANQHANMDLTSDVVGAFIRAKATVDLRGDHYTEATIETGAIPLGPVLALYSPSVAQGFEGQTELHATLKGPLQDKKRIEAHITVPTFQAAYQNLQLANDGPIRLDLQNAVAVLQPASFRGTDTNLQIQGRVPLTGSNEITADAHGSVNVRLVQIFDPDLKGSGAILINLKAAGSRSNPGVQGQINLQNVAFSSSSAPLGVSKLNGTLDVNDNKVQIASLNGEMGGGQISAQGSIAYRPAVQFNVALSAKSVRLLYPDGVRSLFDSNLAFVGTTQDANLTGRVLISSLNFTPDFDLHSFASQFGGPSVPSGGESFADKVKLNVAVQSTEGLQAVSSTVSLAGQANLRVIGTASDPVIVGRTDLTSGELFFMSNRYVLERGVIMFDSPARTEPVLNVQVSTTVQQYNLTISLVGPIERLRTNYSSNPPLATADIINLLARGQTTEQTAGTTTSADSILAGQVANEFSNKVSKLAGISSLQIDPLIGGNNGNPSARIALQQRVTKNFLFTFSTDVSQPQEEIIQGDYQFNKRWSVSVTRDQVGGVSVDGKYHTQF